MPLLFGFHNQEDINEKQPKDKFIKRKTNL
jgi:hypothetical protein